MRFVSQYILPRTVMQRMSSIEGRRILEHVCTYGDSSFHKYKFHLVSVLDRPQPRPVYDTPDTPQDFAPSKEKTVREEMKSNAVEVGGSQVTEEISKMHLFRRLALASVGTSLALSLHRGLLGNFAVQDLHVTPGMFGMLTGLKELPGLFAFVLMVIAARFRPILALSVSAALIGAGISLTGTVSGFRMLVVYTLVMSVGLHVWSILRDTTIIQTAPTSQRAANLGQMVSFDSAASVMGMALIWLLSPYLSLSHLLILSGIFGVVSSGILFTGHHRLSSQGIRQKQGIVFRKRYRRYYTMTVLSAAREMVVITFASYLLLQVFHASVQTMAVLFALQSALAVATRPWIGKIVDRYGQEQSLGVNYAFLVFVFVGYAFVHAAWLAYLLYIVDDALAGFDDLAISSYAGRMVDDAELTPTLAMGNTLAHIAAFILPVVGGWYWGIAGRMMVFLLSALIALIAMGYCLSIRRLSVQM